MAEIDDFLAFKSGNQNRAPATIAKYRDALGRLQAYLGDRPLDSATEPDLMVFCGAYLHKTGVNARSRRPFVAAVREYYRWAVNTRRVATSPASAVPYPNTGRPLPKVLSLANAEKLMWGPDFSTFNGVRDAAMLGVLIGCGLRVSGLCALNESDLQTNVVDGKPRMVLRASEKGKKQRLVPVPVDAEMMLRVYLDHLELAAIERDVGDGDRVLFVTTRNQRCPPHEYMGERRRFCRKGVWEMVQKYGRKAGVPVDQLHPHAMRHLYGTELQEGDVPLLQIQNLMGHVDPKSTEIYVHLATRRNMESIDKHGPLGKMRTPISDLLAKLPQPSRPSGRVSASK